MRIGGQVYLTENRGKSERFPPTAAPVWVNCRGQPAITFNMTSLAIATVTSVS